MVGSRTSVEGRIPLSERHLGIIKQRRSQELRLTMVLVPIPTMLAEALLACVLYRLLEALKGAQDGAVCDASGQVGVYVRA